MSKLNKHIPLLSIIIILLIEAYVLYFINYPYELKILISFGLVISGILSYNIWVK
jgi:hypothetical protein